MAADTTFAALDGAVVDGEGIFSLTTIEPVHKFSLQIKSLEDGVAVYRDDVLVSAATEATMTASGDVVSHSHRVSHFLAVVGRSATATTPPLIIDLKSSSNWADAYYKLYETKATYYQYALYESKANNHDDSWEGLHHGIRYYFDNSTWTDGVPVDVTDGFPTNVNRGADGVTIQLSGGITATFDDPFLSSPFLSPPAVSEFRAWYGATRAIVGPNDAREVVAAATVHSIIDLQSFAPLVDSAYSHDGSAHVYKKIANKGYGLINMESVPPTWPLTEQSLITYSTSSKQWSYDSTNFGPTAGSWSQVFTVSHDTVTGIVTVKRTASGTTYTINEFVDPFRSNQMATLFDGVLDLHPIMPLRFETSATDKVLLYAQIPKNVIPTSAAVWSQELVSASLYLADDLPSVPSYLSTNSPTVFKFYIEEPADMSDAIAIKTFQVLGANFTTVFETGVNKCTQTELDGLSRGHYFAAWGSAYSCSITGETDAFKDKGTLVFTITTDATPTAFEVTTVVNQYPGWKITDDDGVVLLVSKNEPSKTTFKHMISLWTTKLLDATLYAGYARAIGPDPTFAVEGSYVESGAEAVDLQGAVVTSVTLTPTLNTSTLGKLGDRLVTYGGAAGYSETTRRVITGPVGPTVTGIAGNVDQNQDSTGSIVIDLASFFNVGNTNLEYQVTRDNHALLDVSVNGSILTLTKKPETSGTAAVTVSAFAVAQHAQPFRADLSFNFTVIPPNNAPTRTSKALPDVTEPQVFNLAELFQDVDGDSLTYEIIVSNSSVVNTTVVDGNLHVTRGFEKSEQSVTESGTVTIIARDSSAQTNDTFTVTFAFIPQIPVETLAFHHGDFNASDYGATHSDVGSAALAGLVYADTPMGDYAWGTLGAKTPVVSVSFTTVFQGWNAYSYAYSAEYNTTTEYVYDIVYGFDVGETDYGNKIKFNTVTSV